MPPARMRLATAMHSPAILAGKTPPQDGWAIYILRRRTLKCLLPTFATTKSHEDDDSS